MAAGFGGMMDWLQRAWAGRSSKADDLGVDAERCAADFLKAAGYRILGRNLRNRFGEVDLLAEHDGAIVVVEVKAGRVGNAPPEAHVNAAKQRKLVALACQLARRRRFEDRPIRFDVIAVVYNATDDAGADGPVIRHHRGAFESHV